MKSGNPRKASKVSNSHPKDNFMKERDKVPTAKSIVFPTKKKRFTP